uniref:Uncharacterized protein n=1 Tax=Xiphophorus couchianus TaxID=32473 RepID=A0A3B5LB78_9TELE
MCKKEVCLNETKIKLFGSGSIMLRECRSSGGTGKLVRPNGKRGILEEKLLEAGKDMKKGWATTLNTEPEQQNKCNLSPTQTPENYRFYLNTVL